MDDIDMVVKVHWKRPIWSTYKEVAFFVLEYRVLGVKQTFHITHLERNRDPIFGWAVAQLGGFNIIVGKSFMD